jgi:hypothetical protein
MTHVTPDSVNRVDSRFSEVGYFCNGPGKDVQIRLS